MSRPGLISVCIPSFNHARYLPAAIESALTQTYPELEVVVVDDGSSDRSLEIAQAYADRHPRQVRVFTHPGSGNRGIAETVNLAFARARGEFWSGLGSDDLCTPQRLERGVRFLRRNPEVGFVYGPARSIDDTGRELPQLIGQDLNRRRDPLAHLILKNVIPGMAVVARRAAMERIGPRHESLINNDWEMWIRLLAHFAVGFVGRPMGLRRLHDANVSIGTPTVEQADRDLDLMRVLQGRAGAAGCGRLAEPRIRALLDLRAAELAYLIGERNAAAADLARAFDRDATLRRDPRFLSWWLAPRHRRTPAGPGGEGLGEWVADALPAAVPGVTRRRLRRYLAAFELRKAAAAGGARGLLSALRGLALDPGHLAASARRRRRPR